MILRGQNPTGDPDVDDIVPKPGTERWNITTSTAEAVPNCDVILVTVPTPITHDLKPDLSYVVAAGRAVFEAIPKGSILGHAEQEMREKLDEIIAFSELGEFIDQPLRTYSSGMKARLGLAVASAIRPDILLIDEVLSVGDPTFKEKSKKKILSMVQDASTVVIVSHSFALLTDICDRVILIDNGKVISDDAPQASIKAYYEIKNNDS